MKLNSKPPNTELDNKEINLKKTLHTDLDSKEINLKKTLHKDLDSKEVKLKKPSHRSRQKVSMLTTSQKSKPFKENSKPSIAQ